MKKAVMLLVLLLCSQVNAVTFFVKNGGDDSKDGLSDANAWEFSPSMASASGVSNGTTLAAGDFVLFSMDNIWRETITVPASGSSGSPITYDTYGTGAKPIINGSDIFRTWTADGGSFKKTITTEPLIVIYDDTILTANDGATNTVGSNEWDWVTNVLYVNVGENPDTGILEAGQRLYCISSGVEPANRDYITIQNLETRYSNSHGIFIDTSSNFWVVSAVNSHHNGDVVAESGAGVYINTSNITVIGCTLNNNARHGVTVESGDNIIIESSTVYDNFHANIDTHIYSATSDNLIVRHNVVYSTLGGTEIGIFIEDTTNASVYNNIVYDCSNGIHFEPSSGNPTGVVYNNTVSDCRVWDFLIGGSGLITVKNNIGTNTGGASSFRIIAVSDSNNKTINNNCWSWVSGGFAAVDGVPYDDFTTYQAATGFDSDSIDTDPQFVDAASDDFHLERRSPCFNAGADVGVDFDFDKRRRSGRPEIGAYEIIHIRRSRYLGGKRVNRTRYGN